MVYVQAALTDDDIADIEEAGSKGPPTFTLTKKLMLRVLYTSLGAALYFVPRWLLSRT